MSRDKRSRRNRDLDVVRHRLRIGGHRERILERVDVCGEELGVSVRQERVVCDTVGRSNVAPGLKLALWTKKKVKLGSKRGVGGLHVG